MSKNFFKGIVTGSSIFSDVFLLYSAAHRWRQKRKGEKIRREKTNAARAGVHLRHRFVVSLRTGRGVRAQNKQPPGFTPHSRLCGGSSYDHNRALLNEPYFASLLFKSTRQHLFRKKTYTTSWLTTSLGVGLFSASRRTDVPSSMYLTEMYFVFTTESESDIVFDIKNSI